MYRPVALEQQARQLLQAGQYDQALQLANTCSLAGAPWAETAFAEAGFLLLQGKHRCPAFLLAMAIVRN